MSTSNPQTFPPPVPTPPPAPPMVVSPRRARWPIHVSIVSVVAVAAGGLWWVQRPDSQTASPAATTGRPAPTTTAATNATATAVTTPPTTSAPETTAPDISSTVAAPALIDWRNTRYEKTCAGPFTASNGEGTDDSNSIFVTINGIYPMPTGRTVVLFNCSGPTGRSWSAAALMNPDGSVAGEPVKSTSSGDDWVYRGDIESPPGVVDLRIGLPYSADRYGQVGLGFTGSNLTSLQNPGARTTFIELLQAKAADHGVTVKAVNPAYTSSVCCACAKPVSKVLKPDTEAKGHGWVRCDCGMTMDRDANAARNIANKIKVPGATPAKESTQVEVFYVQPALTRAPRAANISKTKRSQTPSLPRAHKLQHGRVRQLPLAGNVIGPATVTSVLVTQGTGRLWNTGMLVTGTIPVAAMSGFS